MASTQDDNDSSLISQLISAQQAAQSQSQDGAGVAIFYEVHFKCFVDIFLSQERRQIGDMVVVQCDRGYHVGFVNREVELEEIPIGTLDGSIQPKKIICYLPDEDQMVINLLQSKIAAENYALTQCKILTKGRRLGILADTISAEFQFDRKKLTIYIKKYDDVSVCRLVRKLYDIFKMRIKVLEVDSANILHDFALRYLSLSKLNVSFVDVFNFNLSSAPFLSTQYNSTLTNHHPKHDYHRQKNYQQHFAQGDSSHLSRKQLFQPVTTAPISHYPLPSRTEHISNSPQFTSQLHQRHSAPAGLVQYQTPKEIVKSRTQTCASIQPYSAHVRQLPTNWSTINNSHQNYYRGQEEYFQEQNYSHNGQNYAQDCSKYEIDHYLDFNQNQYPSPNSDNHSPIGGFPSHSLSDNELFSFNSKFSFDQDLSSLLTSNTPSTTSSGSFELFPYSGLEFA